MTPILSAVLLLVAASAQDTMARDSTFEGVDRIVAIVGGVAIPLSRVEEQINVMRARGEPVPSDSLGLLALRREIVNTLIDGELIVQQARGDTSIAVDDADVQAAVEETVRRVRQQFRSDADFERQLGASGFGSMEEYRRWLADQSRRDLLQQALMRKLQQGGALREVQPTERELREFYERVSQNQPPRPASLTFRQVVVRARPDSAALAKAWRLADSLVQALRAGADFATVARQFSGDSTSREQGGDLGWFRRGQMLPEFEQVAFRLRPGYISNPVLSPYGYHIIQVQRSEPAEVQARHILIIPEVTEADKQAALARADSVARALRAGASLDSLARRYHDPLEQALVEGVVRDSLPPEYREALADAKPGDVAGPIALQQPGRTLYAVVRFESERPVGPYTYEELKDRIRSQLVQEGTMRRYLNELRRRVYVEIRLEP